MNPENTRTPPPSTADTRTDLNPSPLPATLPDCYPAFPPDGTWTAPGTGDVAPPDDHPEVPGYTVTARLAVGGMGVVYAARDLALDREVAIKTLRPGFIGRPSLAAQFERESRITARLPHPGVPPVHAVGTLPDGRPFLAMKRVVGRTLAELLATRPSPGAGSSGLISVFESVCQTVGFAHARGFIHRDLKPANVMVGEFGEVQVMDWGLAKEMRNGEQGTADEGEVTASPTAPAPPGHAHAGETRAGDVKGTPAYMAPEQARGENDRVGPRSDVFALGGVLCAILTGRAPFTGSTVGEIKDKAARADLADALGRLGASAVDPELVALCRRCLAAEPADRPADGAQVAAAVTAHRTGVEERARRVEVERAAAAAEAREQRKRRRVQLMLAGAVAVLFAGGGAFAWWEEKRDAERARVETDKLRAEADAERQAQAVRERISAGTAAAAGLLDQTEAALRASNAAPAGAAFDEAERRIAEGGMDHLRPRLHRCRTELALLRVLDRIDDDRWLITRGWALDRRAALPRWAGAFAGYGIVPGVTPVAEASRRVNEAVIRTRLLTTLESWLVLDGMNPAVREILSAADPDEFRDTARTHGYPMAVAARGFRRLPPAPPQPEWFLVGHVQDPSLADATRGQLLAVGHRTRPDSFALLMIGGQDNSPNYRQTAPARIAWGRAAVALRPENVAAWCNLGIALNDVRDLRGATAAHRRAVALAPASGHAHFNLGIDLFDAGDLKGAIREYRESARLDPTNPEVHFNLGLALDDVGDLQGSAAAFRDAIARDPGHARAYYSLGKVRFESGDTKGAADAFRKATEIRPGYVWAHHNLGFVLLGTGDRAGAEAAFRDAIRADPNYALSHSGLGNALHQAGDLAGAVAAHQIAVELDPGNPKNYYNLGLALADSGHDAGAIAAFREAVRLNPRYALAWENLGSLLGETGDRHGSVAAFREAVRSNPRKPMAHYNLGLALGMIGDHAGAVRSYRTATALDPKYTDAFRNLGNTLLASGDPISGAEAYRRVTELAPDEAYPHAMIGQIHLTRREYAKAIESARRAVALDPGYAEAHALLGAAFRQSGDIPAARAAMSEAARLDPARWGPWLAKLPRVEVAPPPRSRGG